MAEGTAGRDPIHAAFCPDCCRTVLPAERVLDVHHCPRCGRALPVSYGDEVRRLARASADLIHTAHRGARQAMRRSPAAALEARTGPATPRFGEPPG